MSEFLVGTARRDTSCGDMARVYELERDGGLFLKIAAPGALHDEAIMTAYFHQKGHGAEVLDYRSATYDYLVTRKIAGLSGTECALFGEPRRFAQVYAEGLRAIHEIQAGDCPKQHVTRAFLESALIRRGAGQAEGWLLPFAGFASVEEAGQTLDSLAGELREDCLLHGDYCLPNVILEGERLNGVIDVGSGGTGDRHFDLFWALWSMQYNFKTNQWSELFLDVYGRDAFSAERLRLAGAINVFM